MRNPDLAIKYGWADGQYDRLGFPLHIRRITMDKDPLRENKRNPADAARVMRRFSVSNTVLLIICLFYMILYVDRVNISTAAPLIKADLGLSKTLA